jgi:hypothetical protein
MKKKFYLLLVAVLPALPGFLFAQAETFVFEGNNFRWNQTTNGSLFYKPDPGLPGLEVPIGESNHSIFASTLWLGGINQNDELKISFRRFCQNENENCYENWGPLKLNGELSSPEEAEPYNTIWFVTTDQIQQHIDYSNCLNDPGCDEGSEFPNYEIPADFLTWPAHGTEGYAENLAPFADRNGNGTYDPEAGDHPVICGDFSSYAIWNDLGSENILQDGFEIGLEVHTTVYGYASTEGAEFNTLYVQHKLHNRGSETLTETYTGFWTDFDLGNYTDDYVRTDVERSMFYAYNGDVFDDGSDVGPGYGSDLPAMGIKILSGPLKNENEIDDEPQFEEFYANETSGFNDGIIDNERLGLHSSMNYNNGTGPGATQDPQIGIEYYNYMRSIWRDGTPLSFGGIGYDPEDVAATLANYTFPGTSDPLLAGTEGIDPNYPLEGGWTEENTGNPSGDRRMIGSSGPFTFAPGDVQYIDLAYIFARESHDEEETVIETLQRYADEVEGMHCEPLPLIVLSDEVTNEPKPLSIYPNPAHAEIAFDLPIEQATLTIFDITGKEVKQAQLQGGNQRLNIENLESGVYLIRVESADSVYHGKFVVEK